MRLCWGEVFLNNLPEIIVNFPECHDPKFYPRSHIIIGSPLIMNHADKISIKVYNPVQWLMEVTGNGSKNAQ